MVIGVVIVALSLISLAWARDIMGIFTASDSTSQFPALVFAVFCIYIIDFSINAVTACCRSLIVDTLPVEKQQIGSAWASRMIALGHLTGFLFGSLDLGSIFGNAIGDNQLKRLCMISAVGLIAGVGVTSYSVTERVLISKSPDSLSVELGKILTSIIKATFRLPGRIRAACYITFWAWIGWFPFLFYSATWVGETYYRYTPDAPPLKDSKDPLGDIARVGSKSLVLFTVLALVGSVVLPWVVKSLEDDTTATQPYPNKYYAKFMVLRSRYEHLMPDLLMTWTAAHLMFAASMILAPFTKSHGFATFLVSFCGIPWAITCWAPFTVVGEEINTMSIRAAKVQYSQVPEDTEEPRRSRESTGTDTLRVSHYDDEPIESTGELAGLYLGVLNIYVTLPQFVSTLISTIVFAIFEPGKSPELSEGDSVDGKPKTGPNGIAICFFIGALSALVSAHLTNKLRRMS
jgi:solute carrier family 45 protein 1/2/4